MRERLRDLGVELPELPKPLGSYVPCARAGEFVYVSGMLPLSGGKLTHVGKVGEGVSAEEGKAAARQAAINGLAALADHLGGVEGLARVKRCVKVTGYVASAAGFTQQPMVVNGASDLIAAVFGEAGRHARAAVGVSVLPMDAPVEVEFIFTVELPEAK